MRRACLVMALLLLQGCSWGPFGDRDGAAYQGESIGQLVATLPKLEPPQAAAARPSPAEVVEAYERVYGLIPDALNNHAVGKRLADLKMRDGEGRDIAGEADPYVDAVALYETLLAAGGTEHRDEIVYQLARAYDLQGDTDRAVAYLDRLMDEHPESDYALEARFRRAEIAFSAGDYADAARDYRQVVEAGEATPYWLNASYMLGWSRFKLGELGDGLTSFFAVVDGLLGDDDVSTLPATDRELLDDTFRVITLALGYLDGAETLAEAMQRLGRPPWQYEAYRVLADSYLTDERYLDSVHTWQRFIDENALDQRAPNAHIGMIDTLVRADFPMQIRPQKEQFVVRYGKRSQFWAAHDETVHQTYRATLRDYLAELATVAHGEAQSGGGREDFLAAARWYEELAETFPDDPATAEYVFLLGEVYTEAAEHARAVAAYQRVVRDYGDFPRANEAGYAAILGYERLLAEAPADQHELWRRLKIDAQIEFALVFPDEERAPTVHMSAADDLFALGEYQQAVDLAQNALRMWPALPQALERNALLIIGHGRFELGEYVAAETAYQSLLETALSGPDRDEVHQRLLAAIFKQGEASEAAGDTDTAIYHYLRIGDHDERAELAIQGHFDAVALIEGQGRTAEAAELLADFRQRYPDHPLGQETDKRLAAMYESTEDWSRAAAEYVRMSSGAGDREVRRQSLYRAAELYLQLQDSERAFVHFDTYARTYSKPADLRLEAMHQLDLLCSETGRADDRRYWLGEVIETHRAMGRSATARATYLAAHAQYVLAEHERWAFDGIRLSHPLNRSLKRKQTALKRSVQAFERVTDYQVAEFSTAATFQIADLYAALSAEILQSDRPRGLSELELAQYEILLEEQAFPFEEQAIALHEINTRRSWDGVYDDWVKRSFAALKELVPARFDKQEIEIAYVENIN